MRHLADGGRNPRQNCFSFEWDVAGADTAERGTLELYRELVVAVNQAASRRPLSAMTI